VAGETWILILRWIVVTVEVIAAIAASQVLDSTIRLGPILAIAALQAAWSLPAPVRLVSSLLPGGAATFALLLGDVLALTAITWFAGGPMNPVISLYLPLIAIAATILRPAPAVAIALASLAGYSALNLLAVPVHIHDPQELLDLHLVGMWGVFAVSALTIGWFVVRLNLALRGREAALAAAREAALRGERMAALGNLAAGAAHDLGTPLATMSVVAGELSADAGLPDAHRADLAVLCSQIRECKKIITRLSEEAGASRLEAVSAVSAREWIERLVDDWSARRPGCRVHLAFGRVECWERIAGDGSLERALTNLLDNAHDASPQDILLEVDADSRFLRVGILDRGPGIAEEVRHRLGREPVSTRSGGMGIGVLLAASAIERFGGSIEYCRRPGGGTIARASLPLCREPEARAHAS